MENQIILLLDKDSDRIQTLIKDLSSASFTIHFTSDPNLGNLQNGILKLADILLLDIEYLSQFNDSASVELFLNSLEIPFLYTTNNKEFKIPKELEKITSFGIIDTNSPSSIIISSIQIAANQYSSHEELREKEKSLTESVELLQNILDCSTDFIFVKDKNLRTILCNEMVAKAVGKKASELIGHNDIENGVDIELVKGNPEKGIRGYENDDLAALNGETISNQADYVYSGNDIFVFDTVKRPLRNRKGEIIGLFGISRDITARKNAENLLASERERLAITLHSIGDGVISTNVDGKILMFNKAAEDLTGWNSQIALGQSLEVIFKLVEEQTHSIIENPVEKVLRTRERIELSGHTNLITKNGKMKIISYTADPICDTNNKILGLVIVFRDMTEKIKLEASIQRNQKLESVGILAGGIAHDFNNLLAGIFGYLEIALLFSKENPKVSEYLNKAMTAFSRAKALTLQLLTFSKGGNPIKKMGSLVPILKSNIQFTLSGSNISVEYDLDENLMITEIDENQIGQVIDNIAINALQAMPNGGKLLVKAENVVLKREEFPIQNNQNFVKISFKDTGIGIPKEIIQRIFDPFFSAKKTGNGLGLTTAYSIIQKHNGFLEVESVEGNGATFLIFLPALKVKPVFFHDQKKSSFHKGNARILLMDDEKYIQEIELIRMEQMGYHVSIANHGDEAIQIFKNAEETGNQFQLVILDLTIPGGKGGIQTVEEIRKLNNEIPVIIASGYSESPAISAPTSFGFNASLKKPYSQEELIKIFHKFSL